MADRTPSAATTEPQETLQWIKDWREGMFSSTSRDPEGWPIEMHGLVMAYEELAAEVEQLRAWKAEALRLYGQRREREHARRELESRGS